MKIVNRGKFIKMLFLMIGIIITICFYFTNVSFSKGDVKTKSIYIANGDTLWTIATQEQENNLYYEDRDIRDIVYEIKQLNQLENNSTLNIGQVLVINTL